MKLVLKVLQGCAVWVMLVLGIYVLSKALILEDNYFRKYENAYVQMVLQHDQQMVVGQIFQSQQSWEQAHAAMQMAYADERKARIESQQQLKQNQYEMFMFIRLLEKKHPGLAQDLFEQIKLPEKVNNNDRPKRVPPAGNNLQT